MMKKRAKGNYYLFYGWILLWICFLQGGDGYCLVQSGSSCQMQRNDKKSTLLYGQFDRTKDPPRIHPPNLDQDQNNLDDGKSLMDFHKLNYRLQEYMHSPAFPEGPFKASIIPPQFILQEIEDRISLAAESLVDPPEGWETMERDDPRWLIAPLPRSGEVDYQDAYLRHIRWRRRLGSLELKLWSESAVYGLLDSVKTAFHFNLDDYITQRFLGLLEDNAQKALDAGDKTKFEQYAMLEMKARKDDETEIENVMRAYYRALTARDRSQLLSLWVPDHDSELVLPGFQKARGVPQRMATYKTLNWETKRFGRVKPTFLNIESFGNIAFVHTIETVGLFYNTYSHAVSRGRPEPKPLYQKRIFATTVLRYINKQWRILVHHALRFRLSSLTNDLPEIKLPAPKKGVATTTSSSTYAPKSINELLKATTVLPSTNPTLFNDLPPLKSSTAVMSISNTDDQPMKSTDPTFLAPSFLRKNDESNRFSDRSIYPDGISVTKKTILTLRYLVQLQLLTASEKDILVNHIIDCTAEDKKSSVETAFNLLFGEKPENLLKEAFDRSIEEFCDQCHETLMKLKEMEELIKEQQEQLIYSQDRGMGFGGKSGRSTAASSSSSTSSLVKPISKIFRRKNDSSASGRSRTTANNDNDDDE